MPVEVVPFCHEHTARVIKALPALEGCEPVLRLGRDLRRCHRQRFSFLLNAFQPFPQPISRLEMARCSRSPRRPPLDPCQRRAFEVAKRRSVFVTGEAGSGKSYLLEYLRDHLRERVSVVAPTWHAACRIGGTSVHHFAGVDIGLLECSAVMAYKYIEGRTGKKRILERLRGTEVLILDEVSMMNPAMLDNLDKLCRIVRGSGELFGGIRCIFAGDFMQIRPVKCQRLAFEAECWKELFQDEEQLQTLREVHRHKDDLPFFAFLNRLRYGYLNEEDLRLLIDASVCEEEEEDPSDCLDGEEWPQIHAKNDDVNKVGAQQCWGG